MEKEFYEPENKKASVSPRKAVLSVILAVFVFIAGYGTAYYSLKSDYGSIPDKTVRNLNKIENLISENYYSDYDREKLYGFAEEYMVYGLSDPYSYYLDEQSGQEFGEDITGNYVGIGVTLTPGENGEIKILAPFDGSPAKEAGIMADDILYKVEGVEYMYDNVDEAVSVIKGKPGEKVKLEIIRNKNTNLTFEVEKREIEIESVTSEKLGDNLISIRISRFDITTADDFKNELDKYDLNKETGIILDLRDNPGGVVTSSLEIADLFVSEGILLKEEFKSRDDIVTKADDYKLDIKYPIAMLVNGNSASASEILTGCLKDHGVAKLFGEQTYGKGVLNQMFPVDEESSIVLSIGEYTTPSGTSIHNKGIAPDYEVKLPDELYFKKAISDLTYEEDIQLQKAVSYLNGRDTE